MACWHGTDPEELVSFFHTRVRECPFTPLALQGFPCLVSSGSAPWFNFSDLMNAEAMAQAFGPFPVLRWRSQDFSGSISLAMQFDSGGLDKG